MKTSLFVNYRLLYLVMIEGNNSNEATRALLQGPGVALLQAPEQHEALPTMRINPPTGPHYSVDAESQLYTSSWSDNLFHCCSDPGTCCLGSVVCLWPFLIHQLLNRLPYGARLLPLGLSSPGLVVLVYAVACALYLFGRHLIVSSIGFALMMFISVHIFGMVTSVYKLRTPQESEAWVQSFLCHPCFVARMARHVGRARGWIAPTFNVGVEPVILNPEPTIVV